MLLLRKTRLFLRGGTEKNMPRTPEGGVPVPPADVTPLPPTTQEPSREKEKWPILYFMYRDNDLFKRYMPKVLDTFRSLGYRVETQIFAQGTGDLEMLRWVDKHREEFKDKAVIADDNINTFNKRLPSKRYGGVWTPARDMYDADYDLMGKSGMRSFAFVGGIDDIFRSALNRVMCGREKEYQETNLNIHSMDERANKNVESLIEFARKLYVTMLRELLKNVTPQKVFIIQEKINDHVPFSIHDVQHINKEAAAQKLKEWFSESGIDPGVISFATSYDMSTMDKEGNWIIMDRHNRDANARDIYKKARRFRVPTENFFDDIALELKSVDPEEFERALERMIREQAPIHFAKPKEQPK